MLRHTFIHIPGIGPKTEQGFWAAGVDGWDAFFGDAALKLPAARRKTIAEALTESRRQLDRCNPGFFARRIPASQQWRLFSAFRGQTAYLDIETTGLEADCTISTIAVYDGSTMATYVNGRNLDDFIDDIGRYRLLVTYNGKCFDVPVIERHFGRPLDHAHIDPALRAGQPGPQGRAQALRGPAGNGPRRSRGCRRDIRHRAVEGLSAQP